MKVLVNVEFVANGLVIRETFGMMISVSNKFSKSQRKQQKKQFYAKIVIDKNKENLF
jgi:hypothetical protein